MPRTASYSKNIACLESLWNTDLEDRWSVRPILDVVVNTYDLKLAHLTCNTEPEFTYNLRMLGKRRSYAILYLAFHGSPGTMYLADGSEVTLEALQEMMASRFTDWIIHFGSCSTIAVSKERLRSFVTTTETSMVMGYTKDIDWIESSAFDLILFQALQQYVDMRACWRYIQNAYPDLIERTGLTVELR
jgi:hypothetical protein